MTAKTGARIRVVYPTPSHQVYEDSTFLMGAIEGVGSGARLQINGKPVPVSKRGFFAWKVGLKPGMNPMRLDVLLPNSTTPQAQEMFAIHRVPPAQPLPALPLVVDSEALFPETDVWLSKGDKLTVACRASVDAQVHLTIPGLLDTPVPLQPLPPDGGEYLDTRRRIFAQMHWTEKRIPLRGYYQVEIPSGKLFTDKAPLDKPLSMILHVKHGGQSLQKTIPGKLTLLSQPKPAVLKENAVSRVAPNTDARRLTPQLAGTAVSVDGLLNGWTRLRLVPGEHRHENPTDEHMYVPLKALSFQPAAPPLMVLDSIRSERVNIWMSAVSLQFDGPGNAPIQIEALASGGVNRLQIRLYGVQFRGDSIQDPPSNDSVIRHIHWRPVADGVLELWLDLYRPLAGYDYALRDGQWHLMVKTLPPEISQTRVLIDPGHGGAEGGLTGLNGLPEKTLNLKVSQLLHDALQAEGFQVAMVRETDQAVSLEARQQRAIAEKADILLSTHHNALPDGRDPLKAEGVSLFYYHPFAQTLAESLLEELTKPSDGATPWPNYGLFTESLFIPRIFQCTSVLIELGFFTNPTEFERLIDPAYQQEAARRITAALVDYHRRRQI